MSIVRSSQALIALPALSERLRVGLSDLDPDSPPPLCVEPVHGLAVRPRDDVPGQWSFGREGVVEGVGDLLLAGEEVARRRCRRARVGVSTA